MTIATRHHWNHPPPPPPTLPSAGRRRAVGIGVALVLAGAATGYVAGLLGPAEPCLRDLPPHIHQDDAGFWWAGTIGPYGWSVPGTNACITEVPDDRP